MSTREIPDPALLARAQGCLLGQLAGDALGSMVEFKGASAIAALYPRGLREIGPSPVWGTLSGQPTDDSEMALLLARALVRGGFSEQGAANQSPLGIWGYRLDPGVLDGYARADARLTHANPLCQDASAAFLVALAATIREGLDGPGAYARAYAWQHEHAQSAEVTAALAAAQTQTPNYERHQGYVLIALQNAFYQALHAPALEAGLIATVMGGGDTDTNGAIAGALLGAIHGLGAIPGQWRDAVLNCRPEQGAPGVGRPRPPALWPVDALELAGQLLAAAARQSA